MTRSSRKKLVKPFEEPKQAFHSLRKLFKTPSLDHSDPPRFELFSDHEVHIEEEVSEIMTETMVEYTMKTRGDYGSGIARQKFDICAKFELKDQILKELRDNTFSRTNGEDTVQHIEKVLEMVDLFTTPNETTGQLLLHIFSITLTEHASKWFRDELDEGSNGIDTDVECDPTNLDFAIWLASKFSNHRTMDWYTKNALWIYWKRGDDVEIDVDVLTGDLRGFKTYEAYKDAWIYEWNKEVPCVEEKSWLEDGFWKEHINGMTNDDAIQGGKWFDEREPMEDNDDIDYRYGISNSMDTAD
ncbi:hypothetical protein Tco_0635175 [Tanacetum coccineum]